MIVLPRRLSGQGRYSPEALRGNYKWPDRSLVIRRLWRMEASRDNLGPDKSFNSDTFRVRH
jgi:hypothetical protein